MTSSPRSCIYYEPRQPCISQWQPGEQIPVRPFSYRPASATLSFDSSLGDDKPQMNHYEQMWEDVQSLLRARIESSEAKWLEITCQMQQMEEKLASIQTQISEHCETPWSSDSSTTSSRKRKKRTLQVCKPIYPPLSTLPLCNLFLECCENCAQVI